MNGLVKKYQLSAKYGNKKVKWGPWASLLVSIGAYLVPVLLLGVIVGVVAVIRGVDDTQRIIDENNLLQVLMLGIFVSLAAVSIVLRYVSDKGGALALGFDKFKKDYLSKAALAYVVYFLSFIVIFFIVSQIDSGIGDQEQNLGFDDPKGFLNMVYVFFLLVIIPPLYEEILFRGFFFQGVAKVYGFVPAAIGVNGLFAAAHRQLNVGIDTFILGVVASWLVWKTKSIWPAIALHAIKNLVAYVFRFVFA